MTKSNGDGTIWVVPEGSTIQAEVSRVLQIPEERIVVTETDAKGRPRRVAVKLGPDLDQRLYLLPRCKWQNLFK